MLLTYCNILWHLFNSGLLTEGALVTAQVPISKGTGLWLTEQNFVNVKIPNLNQIKATNKTNKPGTGQQTLPETYRHTKGNNLIFNANNLTSATLQEKYMCLFWVKEVSLYSVSAQPSIEQQDKENYATSSITWLHEVIAYAQ